MVDQHPIAQDLIRQGCQRFVMLVEIGRCLEDLLLRG